MWLAGGDIITAEKLEKETLLSYYSLLNTKIVQAEKQAQEIENKRRKHMNGGQRK